MPRPTRLPWLLLLLALAGCSRCGRAKVAPVELTGLLTRDCEAALVVPQLGTLGEKLEGVEGLKVASFVAQLQGFGSAGEYSAALFSQIGVDLRSREDLAKAGIDPARGLAVVFLKGAQAYSVVAVGDERKLGELIERLAATRLGAKERRKVKEGGLERTELSATAGGPARLAYAFRDGHAFLAADASASLLPTFLAVTPATSLAADATLMASLERLPAARDLVVLVPPASTYLGGGKVAAATASATFTASSLDLRLDVPFPGMTDALRILSPKPAPPLLPQLPADAFLAGRFTGEATLLSGFTRYLLGPHLTGAFEEAGFDVKAEILDNLEPGGSFAVSLAPDVNLAGGMPELDVRQTNPFRYVHFTAIAQAKDGQRAAATLEKLAPIGPRFGARITPAERGGRRVFLTAYSQGEGIHFAAAGDKVVMAAPVGRLDQLLAAASSPADPNGGALAASGLRSAFDGKAVAAVVDLRRLAESVRTLPPEAWGVGGFAMQKSALRWLEATDDLVAITLSAAAVESAVQAEVSLRIRPAASSQVAPK